MLVADLFNELDELFPFMNAPAWDPVGLQIGDRDNEAERVAVCHEVTGDVVDRVLALGVDTLVSYHPLLFDPVVELIDGPGQVGRAIRLIRGGVSLIVLHTAMDVASNGTGDALLAVLGITAQGKFGNVDSSSEHQIGRYGSLAQPLTTSEFAVLVGDRLGAATRIAGDLNKSVSSVGVLPGSGSGFIVEAAAIVDVLVTGDVSHHRAREAVESGVAVIDAGHIPTERPGVESLYAAVRDVAADAEYIDSDPHPWEA
ncbi:MAG: Nif3-like dinuclear metal center hexameric protein [Actinomycetota bacterium]|nr:Nif3-like dinuclear metal center hexameric protein [Actinomycetota bacterium]